MKRRHRAHQYCGFDSFYAFSTVHTVQKTLKGIAIILVAMLLLWLRVMVIQDFVNCFKVSSLKRIHQALLYCGFNNFMVLILCTHTVSKAVNQDKVIILSAMLQLGIQMIKMEDCFKISSLKRRLQAQSWTDCSKQRHNTFWPA